MTQDIGLGALSKPLMLEVHLGEDVINYLAVGYGLSVQETIRFRIYPDHLSDDAHRAFTKLVYLYMSSGELRMRIPIKNSPGYGHPPEDKTWRCHNTSVIDESDSRTPVISIDKVLLLWEKDYDESKAAINN